MVICQISDYYFVRRGHYRVKDLYSTDRDGWYWYTSGINFRCVLRRWRFFPIYRFSIVATFATGRASQLNVSDVIPTSTGHMLHTSRASSSMLWALRAQVSSFLTFTPSFISAFLSSKKAQVCAPSSAHLTSFTSNLLYSS